ncbi:h domain protein [Nocardia sp. CDC159]|uniref:H domain protein n=1 Tax=Nocardia pulmonis TaxID=2951408 RepID=A0A9X2E2I5_9NOCA|nr:MULTISPECIES: h domain protein [Nocardia]MCM6772922.1 h domain protein [Nocardia pulmonis]MCM6785775.1 h domain protein [Nocardia sp. CDC159]
MNGNDKMRLILIRVIAVGLIALSLGSAWYLYHSYRADTQAEQARTDSVAAARRTVEGMFTYDFHSVDTELPKIANNLAPGFRDDYLKLINQAIVPGAKEKQLTVQATAQAAGIVSAQRSHAVVLVYLNQVTTSKDSPQGTVTPSRVRVSLDRRDGQWLVAQVTPI